MIEEWDATLFDWITWRNNNIWNAFHIPCRTKHIILNKRILRQYAVGWCKGERLICRPKLNHTAIMFFKDDEYFWFHLRTHEFEAVFPEEAYKC